MLALPWDRPLDSPERWAAVMKLQSIELRNFLSHEDTTFELNGARLATIVGPNGAGKSSLLDGVLYCLFDSARGKTDDLVRHGSSEMSAQVTFEFAGSIYRATRGRTTRSGGKTFLELAIAMGPTGPTTEPLETVSWRPLTGDDIRSTQAAIEALLHVDADTFGSAAFLTQGAIDRFTAASPRDRKRVLGQILGLDRYEAAEARARELAREMDGRLAAGREQLQRLDEQLADGQQHHSAVEYHSAELTRLDEEMTAARVKRDVLEQRLRELAAHIATIAAAEADVTRLQGELDAQKDRWKRAEAQRVTATASIERAESTLKREDEITGAVAWLDRVRGDVADLEAREQRFRTATEQLQAAKDRLAQEERAHDATVAEHGRQRSLLEARVAHLEVESAAAEQVQCPECRHRFKAVRGGLAAELETARQALAALPASASADLHLARFKGLVTRAESALTAAAFDPARLRSMRQELLATERLAAEAPAIAAARQALADGSAAVQHAVDEQTAVTAAGKAAREALAAAQARVSAAEGLHAQERTAKVGLAAAAQIITALEEQRTATLTVLGRAQALVEELERIQVQRDELDEQLAGDVTQLERTRKLVTAFGPTGIPARIIEGILPELTAYAQALLSELRPGMALEIRAQRAKKSGTGVVEALDLIVRDDAGERPLAMFSGGERMSVSLALAVGLSRLVARRAGTAIRTLVIDEPDGLDSDARRSFGQALRLLAHHGELERVVLVSHHADLAEFGDSTFQVSKNGHGSEVVQVA